MAVTAMINIGILDNGFTVTEQSKIKLFAMNQSLSLNLNLWDF